MVGRTSAVLFLLLAAPASAYTVAMETPSEMLPPGLAAIEGTLTITATCQEVMERTPPLQESTLAIHVRPQTQQGVFIIGPSELELDTSPCITNPLGVATITTQYGFGAGRDAPGLVALPVTIEAELDGGAFGAAIIDSSSGETVVDFYAMMSATVDEPVQHGDEATYVFELTNFGNAATVASFSLETPPPEGVDVMLPSDVTLGSSAWGQDNRATTAVQVTVDPEIGWVNQINNFQILIRTWAADDPGSAGPDLHASLLLRTRELNNVPSVSPAVTVAGLLGVALLLRRRA